MPDRFSQRVIERPDDQLNPNQFILEIEGESYSAFTQVGGISKETGTFEWVDGGTGLEIPFPDGVKSYGPLNLTQTVDPSNPSDYSAFEWVVDTMADGERFNCSIVKYHNGDEVFRIRVNGMLFSNQELPDLDKGGSGMFEITYECPCVYWELVR